jgi:energy-converting hydrogenase B subunit Q
MARTPSPETSAAAARLDLLEGPEAVVAIVSRIAERGGRIRTVATIRALATDPPQSEIEVEVDGLTADELLDALEGMPEIQAIRRTRALGSIFGKRVIVVGGGAQVAQVALGAVSEADRHNLRGERISVDTIPLVGEEELASAVRAVLRLPRVRLLVLAGSLMGGEISKAVEEVRQKGLIVISLNQAGSVPDVADLVVSDPVQAGVMAVMAIADTAKFDIIRQQKRRY